MAATLPELPSLDIADPAAWGKAEFRSTSAWSMPEVLGELGRFNSAPWIAEVDVPTAVVVTASRPHDPGAQAAPARGRASRVRRCTTAPGGHASIVLGATTWLPVFLEAVADVVAPVGRRARRRGLGPDQASGL